MSAIGFSIAGWTIDKHHRIAVLNADGSWKRQILKIVPDPDAVSWTEEDWANAHLAARAPELYCALQDCVNWMELREKIVPGEQRVVDSARLVLASARGESP